MSSKKHVTEDRVDLKKVFLVIAVTGLVAFVVGFLTKLVIAGIVGGIIGALITLFALKRSKSMREQLLEVEAPQRQNNELHGLLEALAGMNLSARVYNFDQAVLEPLEKLIDQLKTVTLSLFQDYPDNPLTTSVAGMISGFLPRVVKDFALLNPTEREGQSPLFTETLNGMVRETEDIQSMIENFQAAEFESKAELLNRQYPGTKA